MAVDADGEEGEGEEGWENVTGNFSFVIVLAGVVVFPVVGGVGVVVAGVVVMSVVVFADGGG